MQNITFSKFDLIKVSAYDNGPWFYRYDIFEVKYIIDFTMTQIDHERRTKF